MAKGQKHGNREAKKPKTAVKKPAAGATAAAFPVLIQPSKGKSIKK